MPRLSAWSVRLAMLYLLLGFTFGALMLANKGIPFAPWLWRLLPAHMDILLFGFVIQLAMGFAFWILPRYRGGSRGNERVVWFAVILLNLGIWTITIAGSFSFPRLWMVIGRSLEGLAAFLFVIQYWRRVRPS
jgi:hypothetical protein